MSLCNGRRWEDIARELDHMPSQHPRPSRKTQAGPARHVIVGTRNGRTLGLMYVGMRNYPPVEILLFKDPRPSRPWHFHRHRAVRRYARDKYARDLRNAITDAWRC